MVKKMSKMHCHSNLNRVVDNSASERFESQSEARATRESVTGAAWAERNPDAFAAIERRLCAQWMAGEGGSAMLTTLLWLRTHGSKITCAKSEIRGQMELASGIVSLVRRDHPSWFN